MRSLIASVLIVCLLQTVMAQAFEPRSGTIVFAIDENGCPEGWQPTGEVWVKVETPDIDNASEYIRKGNVVVGLVNLRLITCFFEEQK